MERLACSAPRLGRTDGQQHRAPRALCTGGLNPSFHRAPVSRDHHLVRCIEIDRFDDLALSGFLARRAHGFIVEP